MNQVRVRKIGRWWLWYCQVPTCLDHASFGFALPGIAADAGRTHHSLWHCDGTRHVD